MAYIGLLGGRPQGAGEHSGGAEHAANKAVNGFDDCGVCSDDDSPCLILLCRLAGWPSHMAPPYLIDESVLLPHSVPARSRPLLCEIVWNIVHRRAGRRKPQIDTVHPHKSDASLTSACRRMRGSTILAVAVAIACLACAGEHHDEPSPSILFSDLQTLPSSSSSPLKRKQHMG